MAFFEKTGITHLRLVNFRSYAGLDLTLEPTCMPIVLTGHNGAGKTNILEAISFLTPGRGLRSARLTDVARRENADISLPSDVGVLPVRWSVAAQIISPLGEVSIGTGTQDGSDRRQIRIDGKQTTKQADLSQYIRCLWLTPAQDRLFCGDPVSRRRFLDRLVGAFDATHATRLSDYNTALKQWNSLLREGRFDTAWLEGLEAQLVANGVAIAASRLDVVSRIQNYLAVAESDLFPTAEIHLTGILEKELQTQAAVDVEDMFALRLKQARKVCAEGGNLTGPHTADFTVIHQQKNRDAGLCSTGEQKALLLSIILAEMRAMMQEQGLSPLLLLDEVAAHLDSRRRNVLFDILAQRPAQVWMTGTDESAFTYLTGRASFFDVEESQVHLQQVA